MEHKPEFSTPPDTAAEKRERGDLAACYARVLMGDEDGRRVLKDLRFRFGVGREVFTPGADVITAAKSDGQRDVLRHIEAALLLALPLPPTPKNRKSKP